MKNWIVVILCSSFFLFYKLGDAPLWERDEPKYAEPAWRMTVTGDWLTPRFNGVLRFDKPPLFYWLDAISFKLLGKTEFAARLPSALAGIGIALVTWALGKKITNPTTSLLSTMILIISPHFLLQCRISVVDAVLTFFLTLSFYSIYELGQPKQFRIPYIYLCAFAMGMAALTKGPIGVIFPLLIAMIWRFLSRNVRYNIPLRHLIGAFVLFLTIVLPWYTAISKTYGNSYFDSFFLFHNVTRFLQPVDSHKGAVWFYLPIIIAGFFPWSFFLVHAAKASIKELEKSNLLFLVIWVFVVFGFFTVAKTKLGSYIFSVYPALAILSGSYWQSFFEKDREYTLPLAIFILIALLPIAGLSYLPGLIQLINADDTAAYKILQITLFLLSSGFLIAFVLGSSCRPAWQKFSYIALLLTMAVFFWIGTTFIVPIAAKENPGKEIANKLIANGLSKNDQIVLYNTILNGLVFYTDHQVQFIAKNQEMPKFNMQQNTRIFLVFHKKDLHLLINLPASQWRQIYTTDDMLLYTKTK